MIQIKNNLLKKYNQNNSMSRAVRYSQENKKSKKKNRSPSESKEEKDYRIMAKNLVYIIGLSESIADRDLLSKFEY